MNGIEKRIIGALATGRSQPAILALLYRTLPDRLRHHHMDTPLRTLHALAQIAHESDGFATLEEYASGRAYENRRDLGNDRPGDGARFKGRGFIQLTGRANYRRMGTVLGLDLEDHPERAADPAIALQIACIYWQERKVSIHADRDDLVAVTFAINGGLNGLDDRRARLACARSALPADTLGDPAAMPWLAPGARDPAVASLQHALCAAGYPVGIDGVFGPATRRALQAMQTDRALTADGIAGPQSWQALGR